MAKFKSVLSLLVIGMTIFMSNSCSIDNPVIVLEDKVVQPTALGQLEVFVRHKTISGVYMGNVLVELYLTEVDRTNGNIYKQSTTDAANPIENGAWFTDLEFQTYYLKATYTTVEGTFSGADKILCPLGVKTQFHLLCQ